MLETADKLLKIAKVINTLKILKEKINSEWIGADWRKVN